MAIKADYHLHSSFSGDSTTPMEEMIQKGKLIEYAKYVNNYYNSNTKLTVTEVKNYLTVTPIWVKKYISKVSPRNQSEMLMKAYKEMKDKMICN